MGGAPAAGGLLLVVLVIGSLWPFYSGIRRSFRAREVQRAASLESLCEQFYTTALREDYDDKADLLVDVCQFLPVPVLERYRQNGWLAYSYSEGKPPPGSMACAKCGKKGGKGEQEAIYLNSCKHCGTTLCPTCEDWTLQDLCPTCGEATGGWDG